MLETNELTETMEKTEITFDPEYMEVQTLCQDCWLSGGTFATIFGW